MFIDETKFKKLCKQAYDGMGIRIGRDERGMWTIGTGWWSLMIHGEDMTNKLLATLTEIVGELPQKGEAYKYMAKNSPESESFGMNVMEKFNAAHITWTFTNVLIRTSGDQIEVMECIQNKEWKTFIPHKIFELFSEKNLKEDEIFPEYGFSTDEDDKWIVWGSNTMWFGAMQRPPRFIGEQNFMNAIKDVNAWWTNNTEDFIG